MSAPVIRTLAAALLLLASAGWAQSAPAMDTFAAEREAAEARDRARLARLIDDREALEAALEEARQRHAAARERRETLEARLAEQRERLEALARRRDEQGADLEAVAGVLDRHVSELRDAWRGSWVTLAGASLPARREGESLLAIAAIENLADALTALTRESGRIERFTAPVAGVDGEVEPREVVRAGALAAFADGRFLQWDDPDMPPAMVAHTPDAASASLKAFRQGESRALVLDPTHGELLDALAQRPSLIERFHQGGAVGYVVVALGGLGLLVALGQYGYLLVVSRRLRRQRDSLGTLRDDNPLGRVLGKFRTLPRDLVPEALEARLDEALLAELPRLERGQPLVKLLAAVAPLLGLLGTVTGMIVTLQAITVFGTGDPQLMASGISQALVTTVLGLITAVPLLFAHTALASRSRQLVGLLEGRASAVLAEHLEGQPSATADTAESRHAASA